VTAMGDVVSICADPGRCLAEVHRVLKPGGCSCSRWTITWRRSTTFIEAGNLEELAAFVKTGRTQWLTKDTAERFEVRMFTPVQIER